MLLMGSWVDLTLLKKNLALQDMSIEKLKLKRRRNERQKIQKKRYRVSKNCEAVTKRCVMCIMGIRE